VQWGETLMGPDRGLYAVCAIGLLVSLLIQVAVASLRRPEATEPAVPASVLPAGSEY
jgi:hypothetical protein